MVVAATRKQSVMVQTYISRFVQMYQNSSANNQILDHSQGARHKLNQRFTGYPCPGQQGTLLTNTLVLHYRVTMAPPSPSFFYKEALGKDFFKVKCLCFFLVSYSVDPAFTSWTTYFATLSVMHWNVHIFILGEHCGTSIFTSEVDVIIWDSDMFIVQDYQPSLYWPDTSLGQVQLFASLAGMCKNLFLSFFLSLLRH